MDIKYMKKALEEANKAFKKNEIPVGCVIVKDNKIIGKGYNLKETKQSPLLHAEMIAISKSCRKIKEWRLNNCDVYVTMAPCNMCYYSLVESRVNNIYYLIENNSVKKRENNEQINMVKINDIYLEHEYIKMLNEMFKKMRK